MANDIDSFYQDPIIRDLVRIELTYAKQKHGIRFASDHEAYAVLLEEMEEADEELQVADGEMRLLWQAVREDNAKDTVVQLDKMRKRLASALREIAQCLAVIEKWRGN